MFLDNNIILALHTKTFHLYLQMKGFPSRFIWKNNLLLFLISIDLHSIYVIPLLNFFAPYFYFIFFNFLSYQRLKFEITKLDIYVYCIRVHLKYFAVKWPNSLKPLIQKKKWILTNVKNNTGKMVYQFKLGHFTAERFFYSFVIGVYDTHTVQRERGWF